MPLTPDVTADAVDREAAWLAQVDDLPPLLVADGGMWQVVQAYLPVNRLATQQTGIYVTRRSLADQHPLSQRYRPQYEFVLKLKWPVKVTTSPLAETEQRNMDVAVGYLLQRIRGPLGDKTHGGRFLSVAEVPEHAPVAVEWDDPETTVQAAKELTATVTYYADENEFNG